MRAFRILSLICVLLTSLGSLATNELFAGKTLVQVTPQSRTQQLIDMAFEKIFEKDVDQIFCSIYQHPSLLAYSGGASEAKAFEIYQKYCPPVTAQQFYRPRIKPKRYFVSLDPADHGVQSWTTTDNKTILFADKDLTFEELTRVILHEMAVATDSKMNMNLALFLASQQEADSDGIVHIDVSGKKNETYREAFRLASYPPIAMSFSTMRAMNAEGLLLSKKSRTMETMVNQEACTKQFYELLNFFQPRMDAFTEKDDSLEGQIMKMMKEQSSAKMPSDMTAATAFLMNPKLKLPEKFKRTFCQFMASPELTPKDTYSIFANGPRPRKGGGWGSTSEVESKVDVASQLKLQKSVPDLRKNFSQLGNKFPTSPQVQDLMKIDIQDRLLIPANSQFPSP